MSEFTIRPTTDADHEWIEYLMQDQWGSPIVVSRTQVWEPATLPGYIAEMDGERVGLITYRFDDGDAELVTLNSLVERRGIGTALIGAVIEAVRGANCFRLWLITTNDNTPALRFYQLQGFDMVDLHRDAIIYSRKLKPQIPEYGLDGIPILHEIEMEMRL